MRTFRTLGPIAIVAAALAAAALIPASAESESHSIPLRQVADMLHAVIEADRTVYTVHVVNRLQNDEKRIVADEHFMEKKALPLPVQLFQLGAERVAEKGLGFSYTLRSAWPINKESGPHGEVERAGLAALAEDRSSGFYGTEYIDGKAYFTAVYADIAVFPGCVACHNTHPDSPRRDFKLNDLMGALVIRLPID